MRNAERLRIAQVAVPDVKHLAQRFGAVTVPGKYCGIVTAFGSTCRS